MLSSIQNPPPPHLNNTQHTTDDIHKPPPSPSSSSNFSIRDYVFSARSKDIKKTWPFSLKNLQLCFKHGVNHPLPPFQHLHTGTNPCILPQPDDDEDQNNGNNFHGEPSNEHVVLLESYNGQSVDDDDDDNLIITTCKDNNSSSISRSGGEHENENENDFPSTTTSVSQSEIESSVLVNKLSSPLEVVEVEAAAAVAPIIKSRKSETTARSSGKKCRLVVKFGANSSRGLTEDIASNCSTVSESMASKVCPVCKTFSSSSNTTLNAHIDQCLSGESSTSKWMEDSKLTTRQHRIKPRKTRFMEDIYTTAKHCTLEELDKRNGTNWATISSMPVPNRENLEPSTDRGKKQIIRAPSVNREEDDDDDGADVGAVYIDASGTKVRILSKLNEEPSVLKGGGKDHHAQKKPLKGSKYFSNKKKKLDVMKRLKHATQSSKNFPRKVHASKIVDDEEEYCAPGVSFKDVERQVHDGIQATCSGSSGKRVCSKRSGLPRKAKHQDSQQQPLLCGWRANGDLAAHSAQSGFGDHLEKRNDAHKFKNLSENPFSAPENSDGAEVRDTGKGESSTGRKRVRSSLIGANKFDKGSQAVKQKVNQLSKNGDRMHENELLGPSNSAANCPSSFHNKTTGVDATSDPDSPPGHTYGFPSKVRSKKSLLSVDRKLPVVDSPTRKKRQLHFLSEINEQHEAWEQHQGEQLDGKSAGEADPESHYDDPDEGEDMDSSVRDDDDDDDDDAIPDKVDGLEFVEEMDASPSTSAETEFHHLNDPSRSRNSSLQAIEEYSKPYCGGEALPATIGSSFIDRQEIFSADEVGPNDMIGNAHRGTDLMDSQAVVSNSFPEVDPIPIPGPPGSFLPSPRDMSSDDFPGNSSLTTSRVHSSQDQHDLVDGDSSDSPLSAASTISNPSAAGGFDLRYSESLTSMGGPPTVEVKNKSGFSSPNTEPLVEDAVMVVMQTSQIDERTRVDGEKNGFHRIFVEKRPFNFRNVDQPCCCQRKEKSSQSIAVVEYQQSPLIKRRAMTSMQQNCGNPNMRPNDSDARPEAFSLSNSRSSGAENVDVQVQEMRPPQTVLKEKGCLDTGGSGSGSGSASPSCTSNNNNNPVLRLMGKNLMVVNKEKDDANAPSKHVQVLQGKCQGGSGMQNSMEDYQALFHGRVVEESSSFAQHSMVGSGSGSNGFGYDPKSSVSAGKPQVPAGVAFEEQCYYYKYDDPPTTRRDRPKAKGGTVTNMEFRQRYANSSGREIIVIDDTPPEATAANVAAMQYYKARDTRQVVGNNQPPPLPPNYSSFYVGPMSQEERMRPPGPPFPFPLGGSNEAQAGGPLIRPVLSRWVGSPSGVVQASHHLGHSMYYSSPPPTR